MSTKNIDSLTGQDVDVELYELGPYRVSDGILTVDIPRLNKFTRVDFIPSRMGNKRR